VLGTGQPTAVGRSLMLSGVQSKVFGLARCGLRLCSWTTVLATLQLLCPHYTFSLSH
jgi:hypothetical protein